MVCSSRTPWLATGRTGEVEDAKNGDPPPKKGRRGRKRKMRSRIDEDDSGETLTL